MTLPESFLRSTARILLVYCQFIAGSPKCLLIVAVKMRKNILPTTIVAVFALHFEQGRQRPVQGTVVRIWHLSLYFQQGASLATSV